jgi:hypothetical protein
MYAWAELQEGCQEQRWRSVGGCGGSGEVLCQRDGDGADVAGGGIADNYAKLRGAGLNVNLPGISEPIFLCMLIGRWRQSQL